MKRINVIGTSGSGKSHLAADLLQNYWKTKQKNAKLFAGELVNSVRLVRITSPKQAELFLANVQGI